MKNLIILIVAFLTISCTDNSRVKNFGGSAKLDIPCGQKVTNITWKEDQLWYSTLPMEEGYIPQIHTFREESSFGVWEGTFTLVEKRCK